MTRRNLLGLTFISAALGFALSLPTVSADPPAEGAPIRLGMAKTFFNDVPGILVYFATEPFGKLMKQTTGLNGKLSTTDEAFTIAQKLYDNKLDLGVFHGHELAWVQTKFPKLTPLMVVANRQHDVRAFVIVKQDSPAKTIADLRGKNIDVPLATKQFCRVFLDKHCTDNAQGDVKAFFASVKKSSTPMEALDDLCRDKSDAVLVDSIGLAFYRDVKKYVFEKNLRVFQQSEEFPQAVIAYRQGGLDQATLDAFHDGLLKAHENPTGRDMMKMWSIEAFETVPTTYSHSLAETLKAYPMPDAAKVSMR